MTLHIAAEPEPETGVYGFQPPTAEELRQARIAPDLAKEAGCSDAERERLILAMLDTEAAFREAEDQAALRATAEHPEPEAGL